MTARLTTQNVIEALAELCQQSTCDGEDEDDPKEDGDGDAEVVEVFGTEGVSAFVVEGHRVVDAEGPLGTDD